MRDIVGQTKTTVDFSSLIDNQRIIFLKIPASLPADVKRFIGTIIVSELLHAIRKRDKIPEKKRQQFCLYVDEFQHFATDDFAIIINEGRKLGAACTISHQERFGQLRDKPSVLGATLATANKIFFQMTVKDAKETAPEFAKPPPTEIRLERPVVISQTPFYHLLEGHTDAKIRGFVNTYLRRLQDQLGILRDKKETARLQRMVMLDAVALSRIDTQLIGFERSLTALSTRNLSIAQTGQTLEQVQRLTFELLFLHERELRTKYAIDRINRFLVEVMEEGLTVGQEKFASYLIERVDNFVDIPEEQRKLLKLYVALLYGDPLTPRRIPHIEELVIVDTSFVQKMREIRFIADLKRMAERDEEIGKYREHASESEWYRLEWDFLEYIKNRYYYKNGIEYYPYPPIGDVISKHPEDYKEYLQLRMTADGRYIYAEGPVTIKQIVEAAIERQVAQFVRGLPSEIIVYDDLPPQILSTGQITLVKEKCFELLSKHVSDLPTILKVLEDFVELCKLLCIPDNQVRVQSHQYIEREVPSRLVTDMVHEMEQELIDLPRFQAYAKFIQEQAGEQTTLKTKIATSPFVGGFGGYEYEDMLSYIKVSTARDEFTRLRSDIEAEIIERQEPWINVSKGTGSKGSRKPPKGAGPQDDVPPSHS